MEQVKEILDNQLLHMESPENKLEQKPIENTSQIDELITTLKHQRKNDQLLITQLMEEIKSLQKEEKENKDQILTLNEKIFELSDFREQFTKNKYSYETRVRFEDNNHNEAYLATQKLIEIPTLSFQQEVLDIQVQSFQLQVAQVTYFNTYNKLINRNIFVEFQDFLNTNHRSGEIYQSKIGEENAQNLEFELKEINGIEKMVKFQWEFDPFVIDENYTNQFLMHYQICKLMASKWVYLYLLDAFTSLRIGYTIIELKHFLRQGKKDQVQFLSLPLFQAEESQPSISHDNRNQIGLINLIAINKVKEQGLKAKEKYMLRTNNLRDLEIFYNNLSVNKDKRKKKILVGKKQKQSQENVFENKFFINDIQKDE